MFKKLGALLLSFAASAAFAINIGQPVKVGGSITAINTAPTTSCPVTGGVLVDTRGVGTLGVQISNTWTGVGGLTARGTIDGTNYALIGPTAFTPANSSTATATIASGATGAWTMPVNGYTKVCITAAGAVTGQADVSVQASEMAAGGSGSGGGGGGASTIADGANVVEGSTTDAAAADANGTINAHVRSTARDAQTVAGTVTSNRVAVNPISGQSGVAAGSGATGATTQRVVHATDDPLVAKFVAGTPAATASDSRQPVAMPDGFSVTTTTISAGAATATVTTPIASPGVVNWTAHGLATGTPITITGGTLPGEVTTPASGATFYVIADINANSFHIARTPTLATAGTAINFTGSSSGTQTGTQLLTQYTVNTSGYGSISHQTINAGTTNTTQFETSDDAQTWNTVCGLVSNGSNATNCITSAGAGVTGSWRFTAQAGLWFRARLTTYTSGSYITAATLRKDAFQSAVAVNSSTTPYKSEDSASASGDQGSVTLGIRRDSLAVGTSTDADYVVPATNKWDTLLTANYQQHAKTYSATVNVAAAASATDIATICGQATTPGYVTKVSVSGQQTTAGQVDMLLIKRSTADTGGTSGAGTAIPHDSGDSAANSAVLGYTANPTTGTSVGTLRRVNVPVGGATSLTNAVTELSFGATGKGIWLKTTSECLAVNLNGVTVTGGTFDVMFEWIELP